MGGAFHAGGFGMYPTLIFGILTVGAALAYAVRPERRFVPLQLSLGIMTVTSGSLGFVTGLIKSLGAIGRVPDERRFIWLIGLGESLNNVALALMLLVFAALVASVGTLRVAFGRAGT